MSEYSHGVKLINMVLALSLPSSFTELPSSEYTIRRILHGIPEGMDDLWSGQSLPLESNFDYMNGGRKRCVQVVARCLG